MQDCMHYQDFGWGELRGDAELFYCVSNYCKFVTLVLFIIYETNQIDFAVCSVVVMCYLFPVI